MTDKPAQDLAWTDSYPSRNALRREVNAMVESVVEAVLDRIPRPAVAGIYLKGSAQKRWDSPVDYVPEVSDVDVHLWFTDDGTLKSCLGTIGHALAVQSQTEDGYRRKIAAPIHTPRPQLSILNRLLKEPDYSPSPPEAVTVVYGRDYPGEELDGHRETQLATQWLLSYSAAVDDVPLHVVDKPGAYLWSALRNLTWRVSPLGPRVLVILETPPGRAWSLNRTQIISSLRELGQGNIARAYRDFYLYAWRYFLSGYADTAAGRDAISAGVEAMRRSVGVVEKLESPS